MFGLLPWIFVFLAAAAVLGGVYLFWESLRAALGASEPLEVQATAEADTRRRLLERKDALLANLRDLKFDYDGGKISQQDFDVLDAKLRAQAKEVLRLLDEDAEPFRERAEQLISERLVAAGRDPYRAAPADAPRAEEADSEAADSSEAGSKASGPAADTPAAAAADADPAADADRIECPSCATLNEPDAVFCKKCGAAMSPDESGESADEGEGA